MGSEPGLEEGFGGVGAGEGVGGEGVGVGPAVEGDGVDEGEAVLVGCWFRSGEQGLEG